MTIINTHKLGKRFGSLKAVDQVNIMVEEGEILGILGANGAGKTTLIKMLCGTLKPDVGGGTVAGFDMGRERNEIRHHIGYMSQSVSLLENMTVTENIAFYGNIYKMNRNQVAARWNELQEMVNLANHKNKLASELPSGLRQMLAFVISVLHSPRLLFLDEPTSGLDPLSRTEIWQQIYRIAYQGATVVMSTHYLDEAWYCDRLILMESGRIKAQGSPEHLDSLTGGKGLTHLFFVSNP